MAKSQRTTVTAGEMEFLLREQARLLLANTSTAVAVNVSIALLTFLAIRTPECAWLLLVALASLLRLAVSRLYLQKLSARKEYARVHRMVLILSSFQGLSWGVATILIFLGADIRQSFFLVAIVCGMSGGSILTLSASFPSFTCFTLAAVLPLVVALLLNAEGGFLSAGLMGIVFLAAVLTLGRRLNIFNTELLLTNRELEVTAEELALHKDSLERLVGERTEELRRQRESYRRLTEEINEAIYELDEERRIRYISPAIERILGHSPERLGGTALEEIIREKDRPLFQAAMDDAAKGRASPLDCRMKMVGGGYRWVRISSRPIQDLDDLRGLRGVLTDIENEKKAEAEKEHLLQRFYTHQKMESLATFAGGVAHEFNNLLTGIQGHASLLAMKFSGSGEALKHTGVIEDQVARARNLTAQLLGTTSQGKYDSRVCDLNSLVSKAANLFQRNERNVRFEENLHDSPLGVEVDKQQLEQVMLNVFVNAVEAVEKDSQPALIHLESGPVSLTESRCEPYGLPAGDYVRLAVSDRGRGMDESTLQRVFEPFFTTKENSRGSGLGLAASYGIVKNHGGFMVALSSQGRGTTMEIYLPLVRKETGGPQQKAVTDTPEGTETILIVDDEPITRNVGRAMLQRLGYTVLVAENGEEAVALAEEHGDEIALVILDMIMPGMDGRATFEALRSRQPSLPVLLASGYSLDSYAREILAKGGRGFMQKPFTLNELAQNIREILAEQEG